MSVLGRTVFTLVRWRARRGLAREGGTRQSTGIRGETYAYWFLRKQGYILVARNYQVPDLRGEIDLVGYDGEQLAFVEVKTRTGENAEPEQAVTPEKQRILTRMARRFLADRHLNDVLWRFDVVAIHSRLGRPPEVRLHKDAFAAR